MIGSSITLCALIFGYFSLQETGRAKEETSRKPVNSRLQSLAAPPHLDARSRASSSSTLVGEECDQEGGPTESQRLSSHKPASLAPSPSPSVRTILAHRPLRKVLIGSFILNCLGTGYDVIFTLVCFTPIHLGGLSLSPIQIGRALAFGGALSIILLPFGFPVLQRRFGTTRLYRYCMPLFPVIYLCFPVLNIIARAFVDPSNSSDKERLTPTGNWVLGLGIAVTTILVRLATMCYS